MALAAEAARFELALPHGELDMAVLLSMLQRLHITQQRFEDTVVNGD